MGLKMPKILIRPENCFLGPIEHKVKYKGQKGTSVAQSDPKRVLGPRLEKKLMSRAFKMERVGPMYTKKPLCNNLVI